MKIHGFYEKNLCVRACVRVCACVRARVYVFFFFERRRGNLQNTPGNSSRVVSDSYRLKLLRLTSPKALFPTRICR